MLPAAEAAKAALEVKRRIETALGAKWKVGKQWSPTDGIMTSADQSLKEKAGEVEDGEVQE
jgi:hypothetical protein